MLDRHPEGVQEVSSLHSTRLGLADIPGSRSWLMVLAVVLGQPPHRREWPASAWAGSSGLVSSIAIGSESPD